jgi:hypothetical protein
MLTTFADWTDLEKLVEWQGPSWIFLGDRPETAKECFSHFNLIMGVSAISKSRDRHGAGTYKFDSRGMPRAQNKNRKLRLTSVYTNCGWEGPWRVGVALHATRAHGDPIVMMEMIAAADLKKKFEANASANRTRMSLKEPKVTPLKMLSKVKECLKSEESMFRFDLFELNQRCVELLRRVQKICVEKSPLDYHDYEIDQRLNWLFAHMLAGHAGAKRAHPTRFIDTCLLVEELVDAEAGIEIEKAKGRCFTDGDVTKEVKDDFKTPFEDNILVSDRRTFGRMIIVGEDGNATFL